LSQQQHMLKLAAEALYDVGLTLFILPTSEGWQAELALFAD